jgi:hypothetical protein
MCILRISIIFFYISDPAGTELPSIGTGDTRVKVQVCVINLVQDNTSKECASTEEKWRQIRGFDC